MRRCERPLSMTLRPLQVAGFSLPLRLTILACVLCLPIFWFASGERTRIDRAIERQTHLANAIRWIGLDDALLVDAASLTFVRHGPARLEPAWRDNIEKDLRELRDLARRDSISDPAELPATDRVENAWHRIFTAPNGEAFADLVDVSYRAASAVSDGSTLSYESDITVADLGDLLDNSFLQVFAPLGSAGQTVELGALQGRVSLDDRIVVAGLLARERGAKIAFFGDFGGSLGENSGRFENLRSAGVRTLNEYGPFERTLERAIRRPQLSTADRKALRHGRADFARATVAFVERTLRATNATLARSRADADRRRTVLGVQTAVAVSLAFALSVVAGYWITRRDRRELRKAQHKADALAAELARQEAERLRMLTAAQFDAVFNRSQMGIALLDRDGVTIDGNPALCAFLGSATPAVIPPGDARFADLVTGAEATYQFETALESASGGLRWAQITVSSVDIERSDDVVAIAMVEDITERRAIEQRLRYEAAHDQLTALPNRTTFLTRLDDALRNGRDPGSYAVLFIDLDKFKFVNDTLGHPAGDRAISIAAQRLVGATRPGDVVARLHGDEFAVLLINVDAEIPGRVVADRIVSVFQAPLTLDGTTIVLTASVGIVAGLESYHSAEHVMRDADVAMYNAKKLGRSTAVVFDGIMQERLGAHVRMLSDVRLALDRNEFFLVYQPIVNLVTGRMSGVEALMRWKHPTLGQVSPVDFIPVAEESDAIQHLGRLALRESCAMLARCDALGLPEITASVNLSVSHLANGNVVRDVRAALDAASIDPHRLMLEITESGLLENGPQAQRVLSDLSALGARLCLDDFGTGYSSLRYLHDYPIDVMKIDRSFVCGRDGRVANEPIVQMLLTLARALGIAPIAEGIETEMQRQVLFDGGCMSAQGYLFSRPLGEAALIAFAEAQLEAVAARTVA